MGIHLKRVYEAPAEEDGQRILVDRLWPRGLTKETARIDVWMKDVAPSHELRKWFHHDSSRWEAFVERYCVELVDRPEAAACIKTLREAAAAGALTLVFSAKDVDRNNATVLRDVLQQNRVTDD
ncbi:DUF488 domain-containing protein [Ferroacidibacillus organovorans]|uniref:MarR family transcriptional regulator n=1 Tax=Ferroacidibacillus organovorans TaxID=1765683 RepID=A0A162U1B8_9BACL|nr:DUF488 family protein [Ferroacidibacillus organovorans]KYP81323.1 hypothetical protein AYJ22_00725 [Ferroacidibacillus organovorans]OAG95110.1 hypothetical protein AYW79_01325 [Ferroacidibacillus organovorans]OPG15100.1 hypothetical protein B2M26_13180 [Ferroacidibacillus organovorans]